MKLAAARMIKIRVEFVIQLQMSRLSGFDIAGIIFDRVHALSYAKRANPSD